MLLLVGEGCHVADLLVVVGVVVGSNCLQLEVRVVCLLGASLDYGVLGVLEVVVEL